MLLAHRAIVNLQNKFGQTVLTEALEVGYVEVVRMLLAHHANVNIKDRHGDTALLYARTEK